MRIYEEYDSPEAKRKASRGAVRGTPTGTAKGYLLVFDEDGMYWEGGQPCFFGLAELLSEADPDNPRMVTGMSIPVDHLERNCRRIGFDSLPAKWKRAFASKLPDYFPEGLPAKYRRLVNKVRREEKLSEQTS